MDDGVTREAGGRRVKRKQKKSSRIVLALTIVASSIPFTSAQSCIPLSGSTQCPAFNVSSISTDSALVSFL